jgi:hypothetical protein
MTLRRSALTCSNFVINRLPLIPAPAPASANVTAMTAASAAPSGVVAPSAAPGIVAGASTSTAVVTPATMVTVPEPAGVISGDILVAQVTTENVATAPTPPSGWTLLPGSILNIDSAYSYGYYHVVTSAAEPANYSWSLATAQRWGAGITAFSGVDTSSPFDLATESNIVIGGTSKSLTVPGVTISPRAIWYSEASPATRPAPGTPQPHPPDGPRTS